MNEYLVGFNNDGILVTETVSASDPVQAKAEAQPLHPDFQIIAVNCSNKGEQMDSNTQLDINMVVAALREQIGLFALDKAMLTARVAELESKLKEKDDRE